MEQRGSLSAVRTASLLAVLLSLAGLFGWRSAAVDNSEVLPNACQKAAREAYGQALHYCELDEAKDPRLRCYEAAMAVYRQSLENCREGRHNHRF